jgi:hypothetical protein
VVEMIARAMPQLNDSNVAAIRCARMHARHKKVLGNV